MLVAGTRLYESSHIDAVLDSALAILKIHHWPNLMQGLGDCCRTSKRQVAILTWDPESSGFWLPQDYFPEIRVSPRLQTPLIDWKRILGLMHGNVPMGISWPRSPQTLVIG